MCVLTVNNLLFLEQLSMTTDILDEVAKQEASKVKNPKDLIDMFLSSFSDLTLPHIPSQILADTIKSIISEHSSDLNLIKLLDLCLHGLKEKDLIFKSDNQADFTSFMIAMIQYLKAILDTIYSIEDINIKNAFRDLFKSLVFTFHKFLQHMPDYHPSVEFFQHFGFEFGHFQNYCHIIAAANLFAIIEDDIYNFDAADAVSEFIELNQTNIDLFDPAVYKHILSKIMNSDISLNAMKILVLNVINRIIQINKVEISFYKLVMDRMFDLCDKRMTFDSEEEDSEPSQDDIDDGLNDITTFIIEFIMAISQNNDDLTFIDILMIQFIKSHDMLDRLIEAVAENEALSKSVLFRLAHYISRINPSDDGKQFLSPSENLTFISVSIHLINQDNSIFSIEGFNVFEFICHGVSHDFNSRLWLGLLFNLVCKNPYEIPTDIIYMLIDKDSMLLDFNKQSLIDYMESVCSAYYKHNSEQGLFELPHGLLFGWLIVKSLGIYSNPIVFKYVEILRNYRLEHLNIELSEHTDVFAFEALLHLFNANFDEAEDVIDEFKHGLKLDSSIEEACVTKSIEFDKAARELEAIAEQEQKQRKSIEPPQRPNELFNIENILTELLENQYIDSNLKKAFNDIFKLTQAAAPSNKVETFNAIMEITHSIIYNFREAEDNSLEKFIVSKMKEINNNILEFAHLEIVNGFDKFVNDLC